MLSGLTSVLVSEAPLEDPLYHPPDNRLCLNLIPSPAGGRGAG